MPRTTNEITPYIQAAFDDPVEIKACVGERFSVNRAIPEEGRPHRRARGVSIQFDHAAMKAIEEAASDDLRDGIGPKLAGEIRSQLAGYDPRGPEGGSFLITIHIECLAH